MSYTVYRPIEADIDFAVRMNEDAFVELTIEA